MWMITYFARLRAPKLVLWCYLAWYLAIVACYFDPSPVIWFSALGISLVIGVGLIFATKAPGQAIEGWTRFRLFLFPFCVASYSSLIKGKGFFLLFPTEARPLITGISACVATVLFARVCRMIVRTES